MKDIVLWRRKKLSTSILVAATATWVLMELYQFNFLTLISWFIIFVVSSIFLYANMLRLLSKWAPSSKAIFYVFALYIPTTIRHDINTDTLISLLYKIKYWTYIYLISEWRVICIFIYSFIICEIEGTTKLVEGGIERRNNSKNGKES